MAQISDMGEGGNFRVLIWPKSYQGIVLGPIRGPICSLTNFRSLFSIQPFPPPLTGILFMGEGGNFRYLIWQKSYQGASFGPIRGPIGSKSPNSTIFNLRLKSARFSAHSLSKFLNWNLNFLFHVFELIDQDFSKTMIMSDA